MQSFTIKEAFSFAWSAFKKHIGFILPLFIVLGVLYVLIGYGADHRSWEGGIIQFVGTVLEMYVSLGLIHIFLRIYDNKDVRIKDLFVSWGIFWRGFFAGLLLFLIILGGTILLIIPGIVWWITYLFYAYFIVDKKVGIKDALRLSRRITVGERWHLFGFMIVTIFINFVGLMLFGVGAIISMPITMLAMVYVYRKIGHTGTMVSTETSPEATA